MGYISYHVIISFVSCINEIYQNFGKKTGFKQSSSMTYQKDSGGYHSTRPACILMANKTFKPCVTVINTLHKYPAISRPAICSCPKHFILLTQHFIMVAILIVTPVTVADQGGPRGPRWPCKNRS